MDAHKWPTCTKCDRLLMRAKCGGPGECIHGRGVRGDCPDCIATTQKNGLGYPPLFCYCWLNKAGDCRYQIDARCTPEEVAKWTDLYDPWYKEQNL